MAIDILGLKLPLWVASAREQIGYQNLYRLLRFWRLYSARFSYSTDEDDLTSIISYYTLTTGRCVLYYDAVWEKVIILSVSGETRDPNGNLISVDGIGQNNYLKKGLVVGRDCEIIQADSTAIPPLIYLFYMAERVNKREDILEQQDNMLAKPIAIKGMGKGFDDMTNNVKSILSFVQFLNVKGKGGASVMDDLGMEVLDLQVGNNYKGKELWESRDKFENLILDYLGYPTVNGDKKERMITDEVNRSSAFARACYDEAVKYRKDAIDRFNSMSPIKLKMIENIKWDAPEDVEEKKDDKEDSLAK